MPKSNVRRILVMLALIVVALALAIAVPSQNFGGDDGGDGGGDVTDIHFGW